MREQLALVLRKDAQQVELVGAELDPLTPTVTARAGMSICRSPISITGSCAGPRDGEWRADVRATRRR